MVAPPRLAGGYSRAPQALPFPIRSRQHNTQLLDIRVAVDDHQQLSPVDRLRARVNGSLGPGDPNSLAFGMVDNHFRHFAHQSSAQLRRLAIDIDQRRSVGRASSRYGGRIGSVGSWCRCRHPAAR